MPSVKLTFPKKLARVEIIQSKDLMNEDYFAYLPIVDTSAYRFSPEIFDAEIAELRNIDSEKEIFKMLDIPIQQTFYREVSFTDQRRPIKISLNKLPQSTILLSEAKAKIQEAYNKGLKDGQEITEDYFKDEMNRHRIWVKNFDSIAMDLRAKYTAELRSMEESIVSLAMITAEHILMNELKSNPRLITEQAEKVLREIDNETIFKIRVNPKNLQILEEVSSSLLAGYDAGKVKIEADDNVDLLGCILETSSGKIEATLITQLNKIKEKLESLPIDRDIEEEIREQQEAEQRQSSHNIINPEDE